MNISTIQNEELIPRSGGTEFDRDLTRRPHGKRGRHSGGMGVGGWRGSRKFNLVEDKRGIADDGAGVEYRGSNYRTD